MSEEYQIEALLTSSDDPVAAINSAAGALFNAYWKDKNILECKRIGKAAINRGLEQATACGDSGKKNAILGAVEPVSYNLASFLWPGWDEPDIVLAEGDLAIGEQAALLNLRLGIELQRDSLALCRAHWLVGSFRLAVANYVTARDSFTRAANLAEDAGASADRALNLAYAALVDVLGDGKAPSSLDMYDAALEALARVEDGPDFVNQVRVAEKVFSR
jgi:hypothetical protein